MKLCVLISDQPRHFGFANALLKEFDVKAMIVEPKALHPLFKAKSSSLNDRLVRWHFKNFMLAEKHFFSEELTSFSFVTKFKTIVAGKINEETDYLKQLNADACAVFGTGLLKQELIDLFYPNIFNLHLGLCSHYLGAASPFWACHDGRFDLVGATIHRINVGVDAGEIVKEVKPPIWRADNIHSIGCKTIFVGIDAMVEVLKELRKKGSVESKPQTEKGKQFKTYDFSGEHVMDYLENFKKNLEDYCEKTVK